MDHSPDDPQQTDLSAQPPSVPPSPAHFGSLSPAQQAARRELHEQEVRERLNWCLLHGLTPASEHVHRAPGNDANFMFAEPPWLPDGSVNPRGVPFGRPDDAVLHKDKHLEDYSAAGWNCRKCHARVHTTPREFSGTGEPVDWWWCNACKLRQRLADNSMTSRQKKLAQSAKSCMRLDLFWGGR